MFRDEKYLKTFWGRMSSNPTGKPYSALRNDGCSEIVGYPHLNYE